jgi:hypothetical protein
MDSTHGGLGLILEALIDPSHYEMRWDAVTGELHIRRTCDRVERLLAEREDHLGTQEAAVSNSGKVLAELEPRDCRWPIGDPSASDFHFCGTSQAAGLPYCQEHARRAYLEQERHVRRS